MKGKKKDKPSLVGKLIFYTTNVQNNTIKPFKKQENTTLKIVAGVEITELFGNAIPYPNYHYIDKLYSNRLVYCWVIDGFFDTEKGYKFLNDIIARFKLSCDSAILHSLERKEKENQSTHKLKSFQGLKSLAKAKLEDLKVNSYINSDFVYTCIVLQAEKFIKINGLIDYSILEDWAIQNFLDIAKDKSTLKAKCRNCWNWYFNRNWTLYHTVRIKKDKDLVMATRQEHARKIAKNTSLKYERKIINLITGLLKDDYKKPNGSWNVTKIAKDSGTTRPTVMKYLPKENLF